MYLYLILSYLILDTYQKSLSPTLQIDLDPTICRVVEAGFVEVAVHEEVNLVGRERHPGDEVGADGI